MWPARQQLGLILDRWQVSVGKYHDCLIHGGHSSVTVAGKDSSNHDAADSTAQNGNKKIERFATGKCTKENVLCCWKGYVEETSYWAIKHLHMNIISYTIYIYVYIDIDTDIDIDIYIYIVHFNIISCTFRAHCTTIPLRNCLRTILIRTYDNSIASSPST